MRKTVVSFIVYLAATTMACGQTFTDHIQKSTNGGGKVTVQQSKEIDDLVNGSKITTNTTTTATNGKHQNSDAVKKPEGNATSSTHATNDNEDNRDTESKLTTTEPTGKKVVRGGHKVTGYRVQVYAGGNTREDKAKATEAGNAVKRKFPEQPVYVYFYSPRWICRVGNFRTYQEAQSLLRQVRAMGYKAATIVSGKITVQY